MRFPALSPEFVGTAAGAGVAFVLVGWAYLPARAVLLLSPQNWTALGEEGTTALLALASSIIAALFAAMLLSAVRSTLARALAAVLAVAFAVYPASLPVFHFLHYDVPEGVWVCTAPQYFWSPVLAAIASVSAAWACLRSRSHPRPLTRTSAPEA